MSSSRAQNTSRSGCLRIEYGLLTDPSGRPVAVRVVDGNTADPVAFTEIVTVVRKKFGLVKMVMIGDRGMITSARIGALNRPEEDGISRLATGGSPRCAPRLSEG